jgi:hypothetical protein
MAISTARPRRLPLAVPAHCTAGVPGAVSLNGLPDLIDAAPETEGRRMPDESQNL